MLWGVTGRIAPLREKGNWLLCTLLIGNTITNCGCLSLPSSPPYANCSLATILNSAAKSVTKRYRLYAPCFPFPLLESGHWHHCQCRALPSPLFGSVRIPVGITITELSSAMLCPPLPFGWEAFVCITNTQHKCQDHAPPPSSPGSAGRLDAALGYASGKQPGSAF